jgi:hypothetical protein
MEDREVIARELESLVEREMEALSKNPSAPEPGWTREDLEFSLRILGVPVDRVATLAMEYEGICNREGETTVADIKQNTLHLAQLIRTSNPSDKGKDMAILAWAARVDTSRSAQCGACPGLHALPVAIRMARLGWLPQEVLIRAYIYAAATGQMGEAWELFQMIDVGADIEAGYPAALAWLILHGDVPPVDHSNDETT